MDSPGIGIAFRMGERDGSSPVRTESEPFCPFSEERLFACFDELGLEHELYTKRVNEVSGGQRQRIMLAVAAMLNKPLIIIDEPTSALDADSTGRVLSFFRRQAERGTAVLAVSHDKDFASGCHYLIEL